MKEEIWKPISEYEGLYEISSHGNARSLPRMIHGRWGLQKYKGKSMSPSKDSRGYLQIQLFHKSKYKVLSVHRLVAQAFIPNPENKPQVNHIDEVKTNNYVSNLEWVSVSENVNHGTRNQRVREKVCNGPCSKRVAQYTLNGILVRVWPSAAEAGRHGFVRRSVCRASSGERKTYKGYLWKYITEEEYLCLKTQTN